MNQTPALVYVVTYPSRDLLPSSVHLERNLQRLETKYPLLQCRVKGGRTNQPEWTPVTTVIDWNTRIFDTSLEVRGNTEEHVLQTIITNCLAKGARELSPNKGELLTLTRINSSASSEDQDSSAYLVMTVHHILTDGMGGMVLLYELLESGDKGVDVGLAKALPAPLEDTIDIRPTYTTLLQTIFVELLLPKIHALPIIKNWQSTDSGPFYWPHHGFGFRFGGLRSFP